MAETFDFKHSELYNLSIRLSTDGFSFSVYNLTENPPFHHIPYSVKRSLSMAANVKEMLQQNKFLYLGYKQINIYIEHTGSLPVPPELFHEEQKEELYYHSHPHTGNEIVLYNTLPQANVVLLYTVDKTVHQLLKEAFPEAHFYCTAAPLTEFFAGKSYLGNSKKLYAYLQSNRLTLIGFDRSKLLLLNCYSTKQQNDTIYYLLYVWKQLEFEQQRDELYLAGTIDQREQLMQLLRKYIRQVHPIYPTAEFNRSVFTLLAHIPFDLQTSLICDI